MNTMQIELKRLMWGGAALVGAALVALMAIGCGRQEQTAKAEHEAGDAAVAETITPAAAIMTSTVANTEVAASDEIASGDALPPDVTASTAERITAPGHVAQITAQGSPDVTTMVLTDRLGKKAPFAYDSTAGVWRVSYRVPITATGEQVGLSVTATNGANRWKRIWVFVKTRDAVEAEADGC